MAFLHDLPIADLIAHYGYIAIFVIITLESAGLPLPGETVLLTSAAYAGSTGNINIAVVVAIAAAAAILGDNAGYWVGRRWGLPLLLRKGHLIGLDHGRLKLGQYLFRRHGGKIVFFGRFTAMLRAYAAVLAGVNRLDARRFFAFNALGGVVWAPIMGFGAYSVRPVDRERHGSGRARGCWPSSCSAAWRCGCSCAGTRRACSARRNSRSRAPWPEPPHAAARSIASRAS